jgi:hypothetical protein
LRSKTHFASRKAVRLLASPSACARATLYARVAAAGIGSSIVDNGIESSLKPTELVRLIEPFVVMPGQTIDGDGHLQARLSQWS